MKLGEKELSQNDSIMLDKECESVERHANISPVLIYIYIYDTSYTHQHNFGLRLRNRCLSGFGKR